MSSMLQVKPELADKVFDAFKRGMQSNSLVSAYKSLSNTAYDNPELIPEDLKACKKG